MLYAVTIAGLGGGERNIHDICHLLKLTPRVQMQTNNLALLLWYGLKQSSDELILLLKILRLQIILTKIPEALKIHKVKFAPIAKPLRTSIHQRAVDVIPHIVNPLTIVGAQL